MSDEEAFLQGVIAPDLTKDKGVSHYGTDSAHPDLDRYLDGHDLQDDYQRGYFLHLLTDHLFYGELLAGHTWTPAIYADYDRLNDALIEAYQVTIPAKVREHVKSRNDEPEVLDYHEICRFIEQVGRIDLDELAQTRTYHDMPL